MRYLGILLFLTLACSAVGTSTPGTAPPKTTAEHVSSAINVGACVAGEVAPEVRRDVDTLLGGNVGTAERVIGGILAGAGALARSYACYLRDAATVRAQAGGEVAAAAVDETHLVKARAETCPTGAETCKAPALASRLLLLSIAAGKVAPLPEGPPCVPLTAGRPLREGETLCR